MFNFFKKKQKDDPQSPANEEWVKAKEHFDKSDFSSALSILIGGFKKDIYYKPLYELSSRCLDQLGGKDESVLFQKAIHNLNAKTFKQLGSHFYEVEHYPLTKIFLEEAFKKMKDVDIANHLSIAYARRFDTKKAQETLEEVKNKFDFWTFWFYVKMKILNNDQDGLNQAIGDLEAAFDPNSTDENLKIPKQKVAELRESYDRLQLVTSPAQSIRDWQFIQYGTMILNFFNSEDQYVAGGRHVASWGNNASIKSILQLLSEQLQKKGIERIVYANNRDSKILGITLSALSGIPSEAYNSGGIYQNALMLVSDSVGFNEFNNVENINDNVITFSFNHNWLQANFICPDIIGLMAQSYSFPWTGGGIKMNDDGTTSRTEADPRSEEELAEEIVNTEVMEDERLDPFYNYVEQELKLNKTTGHRYNFMVESPVPGSYFGSN